MFKKVLIFFAGSIFTILLSMVVNNFYNNTFIKNTIVYDITSILNVLDIHSEINELQILFQGKDIKKDNLNLTLINLTVKNKGNNIKPTDYVLNDMWGIEFKNLKNGKIVKIKNLEASDDYIKEQLKPSINSNKITFNDIAFDKDAQFSFEILALTPQKANIVFAPFGKISGIKNSDIIINKITTNKSDHIPFPLIIFFIIYVSVFVSVFGFSIYESKKISKQKKQFIFEILKDYNEEKVKYFTKAYLRYGLFFNDLCFSIINKKSTNSFIDKISESFVFGIHKIIYDMEKKQYLKKQGTNYILDDEFVDIIFKFEQEYDNYKTYSKDCIEKSKNSIFSKPRRYFNYLFYRYVFPCLYDFFT